MIGIKEIAVSIPVEFRDNFEQAKQFGESEQFIRERIGAERLPVMAEGQDTSDLAAGAVQNLLDKAGVQANDVDCLVVCTQNPDGCGLPHSSAIVQDKCGLPKNMAAFDISLGCSGYVYGLFVIKGFMEAAGLKRGVLVTADPYSKILDTDDKNTSLLFGDAATATLVTEEPVFRLGGGTFATDGSGAAHLVNNNGKLHMNGRQVFNFAATRVPEQIRSLLSLHGLGIDDIDLFVLHQGSRYIVDTLAKRLDIPAEKVPMELALTGNTVSSSIPLVLEKYIRNKDKNRVVLSGFGVGLSWGSVILYRNNQETEK